MWIGADTLKGHLLVLAAAACFGLSNVLGRMGIERSSVYVSVTWNVMINATLFAVALGVTYWVRPEVIMGVNRDALPYFVLAGLLIDFAGRSSQYASSARLGASRAAAFRVVAPLFAVVLGIVVLHERLRFITAVGVAAMLVGIAIVTRDASRLGRSSQPETASDDVAASDESTVKRGKSHSAQAVRLGLIYGVMAALFYGIGDVARKQGVSMEAFTLVGAAASSWTGLTLYAVTGIKGGRWRELLRPGPALPYVVGAGCFTSAAVFLFLGSMSYIPVSVATPINGTQALFVIAFGWLLNRRTERITPQLLVGSALAVAGLALVVGGG